MIASAGGPLEADGEPRLAEMVELSFFEIEFRPVAKGSSDGRGFAFVFDSGDWRAAPGLVKKVGSNLSQTDLAKEFPEANADIASLYVKANYNLDTFFIDLDGSGESIVSITRYLNGLFSHRRGDDLWKGMLEVRIEDAADDAAALAILNAPASAQAGEAIAP